MGYGFINESTVQLLAERLRARTGTEEKYTPNQFAEEIRKLDDLDNDQLVDLLNGTIREYQFEENETKCMLSSHYIEELVLPQSIDTLLTLNCRNLQRLQILGEINKADTQPTNGCQRLQYVYWAKPPRNLTNGTHLFLQSECLITMGPAGGGYDVEYSEEWDTITPYSVVETIEKLVVGNNITHIDDNALPGSVEYMIFEGSAPTFSASAFSSAYTINCYYPRNDSSWTEEILASNFGANAINWIGYDISNDPTSGIYSETLNWRISDKALIIEGSGEFLPQNLLPTVYLRDIETVELGEGVVLGEDWSFANYENLKTFSIPEGMAKINSFENCFNLSSIEIPSSVTEIAGYSFANCRGLSSIEIPDTVTTMKQSSFFGCTGLKSAIIRSSAPNSFVFRNCFSLESVVLGQAVKNVDSGMFENCFELKTITLPDSLESLALDAFEDTQIKELDLSQTNLNNISLGYVDNINKIILPETITEFEQYSLGHMNLQEFVIPASVKTLGASLFIEGIGPHSIVFKGVPDSIDIRAFWATTDLNTIYVPWSEGEVPYAPWGAMDADIIYNYNDEGGESQ